MVRNLKTSKDLVSLIILSGFTLISGAFLVSPSASADNPTIDDVSVVIPSLCTITGVGTGSHSATVNNGTYVENIGKTTLRVFCNDSSGFGIYAIGFTGDAYSGEDHTKLIGTTTGAKISTGTATGSNSNDPSNWAMKLTKVTDASASYQPNNLSILSGYDSYSAVPSTYTKVASFSSSTDSTLGSNLETTYAAFMTSYQAADTYVGKVKYTLVHPATNVPNEPKTTNAGYIGYFPNAGNEVDDTMGNQTVNASATSATLWASNFKRPGYGFAGWSDAFDYVIGEGSESNPDAHIYGPNETIEFTAGQYTSPNQGLSLYAVWIKSADYLQNWECPGNSIMPVGTVTALTDQRDNNTYAVAKLADGNCWMIENLRLDNTNSGNATGALAQGYGSSQTYGNFIGLANPETANFTATNGATDATTANSIYYAGTLVSPATVDIVQNNYAGYRMPRFRNDNTNTNTTLNPNTTVANMTGTNQNIYSYGNWYSWPAAKANTDHLDTLANSNAANTSICPKGWRLPKGGNKANESTNEFWSLIVTSLNNGTKPANYSSSTEPYYIEAEEVGPIEKKLRAFPNNFVYSGNVIDSSVSSRGSIGFYWSATAKNYSTAYLFSFYGSYVYPGTNTVHSSKYKGMSIRCVLSPEV
ncbi:hypothetical protein J6V85_04330 [Candidatus Saccharibacteria bacterium]|nr:hypothetical protein [Candidatus Saccharibacteria bacterium]